jgi:hypothetical protein
MVLSTLPEAVRVSTNQGKDGSWPAGMFPLAPAAMVRRL